MALTDLLDTKDIVTGVVVAGILGIVGYLMKRGGTLKKKLIDRGSPDQLSLKSQGPSHTGSVHVQTYRKWRVSKEGMRVKAKPRHAVPLNVPGNIVINIMCRIDVRSEYMRFGIKFSPVSVDVLPGNKIENEGTWLFHIGRDGRDRPYFAMIYEGKIPQRKRDLTINGDTMLLSLDYTTSGLIFAIDGREVGRALNVPLDAMLNATVVAWVDHGEDVSFDVNDLQIMWRSIQKGPGLEAVVGTL